MSEQNYTFQLSGKKFGKMDTVTVRSTSVGSAIELARTEFIKADPTIAAFGYKMKGKNAAGAWVLNPAGRW